MSDESRSWRHGLCGCCENGPWCTITAIVPHVTSYQVAIRLGLRSFAYAFLILFALEVISVLIDAVLVNMYVQALEDDNWSYDDTYLEVLRAMIQIFGNAIPGILGIIFLILVVVLRYAMTSQKDLERMGCCECPAACFCAWCSLCQMHDELYPDTYIDAQGETIPLQSK